MRRKFLRKRLINRPEQTRRVQKHSISSVGRGSGNRRAVTLYHHICWLARRTKTEVPAGFLEIAEKARFSHHKLSREELQPLQDHADQLTRQLLADKRFWRQFLYRVIYALG